MLNLDWKPKVFKTHLGQRTLYAAPFVHLGEVYTFVDVHTLFPDVSNWLRPRSEITGFAWHHDGVEYEQDDYQQAEFYRLKAIYDYHISKGWNGIGYHAVQGNSARIYLPRRDVLDTHRAHVSTSASSTHRFPNEGDPNWNRQLIGFCIMGDYTKQGLPPQVMRSGADAFFTAATDYLGAKSLTLRPHKYYQRKPCPGDWATEDSWHTITYSARGLTPTVNFAHGVHEDVNAAYDKGWNDALAAARQAIYDIEDRV